MSEFNKVQVDIGYKSYIVNADDGLKIMQILNNAEMFEEKSKRDGQGAYVSTYYCYEQYDRAGVTIKSIPTSLYRMAKLAGKPPKGE